MAAETTTENYISVQLQSADDAQSRYLRIDKPATTLTRAQVLSVLEPVLFPTDATSNVIPFFYDDTPDPTVAMTKIGEIQTVVISKTIDRLV